MKKMYHVVLLKFAPQKSGRVAELFAALADLKRRLPGYLSFTGGPYSSPEGMNQGFTHGFIIAFQDAGARDQYLSHPEHEKIKQAFLPDVENVVAFDFEGE
jgi:hypothetical protein